MTTINNNYSKIYHLKLVPKINKTLETHTWVEIIIFLPKRILGEVFFFLRMTHQEKLIPQNSIFFLVKKSSRTSGLCTSGVNNFDRLWSIDMQQSSLLLHMQMHETLSALSLVIFEEIAPLFPCLLIVHRAWATFYSNPSLVNCHLPINCSLISLSLDSTLCIFNFSRLFQLDAIIQNYI